jgi:hypothetical protein
MIILLLILDTTELTPEKSAKWEIVSEDGWNEIVQFVIDFFILFTF